MDPRAHFSASNTKRELLDKIAAQEAELVSLRAIKKEDDETMEKMRNWYKTLIDEELFKFCECAEDMPEDAVTLECGHTLCGYCIDERKEKGVEECLTCREEQSKKQKEAAKFSEKPLVENIKAAFECSICKDVLDKAVISCDCGHTFCLACIQGWLGSGALGCPICRETITSIKSNIVVNEAVQYIKVHHNND